MSTRADPSPEDWPITVVARWTDPGYSAREARVWIALLIACAWVIGAILVVDGQIDARFLMLAAVLVALGAWRWLRRRPADIEMVLEPDRLRVRDVVAGTPTTQLMRHDAGWLLAAETGLDWRERLLTVTDDGDREVLRVRARDAIVQITDAASVSESWWRSHMPSGTSSRTPPKVLSATALVGSWWPDPDRRSSLRGRMGLHRPWQESDPPGYDAWDRRQRRYASVLLGGLLVFTYGLALPTTWPWTTADMIALLPPGAAGLALAVRGLVR